MPHGKRGEIFPKFKEERTLKHLLRKGAAIIFFSTQFKMVVHIVKIALHDEKPIISRIDVAEREYMVASKKQGSGKD